MLMPTFKRRFIHYFFSFHWTLQGICKSRESKNPRHCVLMQEPPPLPLFIKLQHLKPTRAVSLALKQLYQFSSGCLKGKTELYSSFKIVQREARTFSLLTDVIAAVRELLVQDARQRTAHQVNLWTVTPTFKTQVQAFNNWCMFLSFCQVSCCTQVKERAVCGQVALSPVRKPVGANKFSSHMGLGAKRPTDWMPPSPAHIFKDGYFNNDCSAMHLQPQTLLLVHRVQRRPCSRLMAK